MIWLHHLSLVNAAFACITLVGFRLCWENIEDGISMSCSTKIALSARLPPSVLRRLEPAYSSQPVERTRTHCSYERSCLLYSLTQMRLFILKQS